MSESVFSSSDATTTAPLPAATVVVLREGLTGSIPEVLLLRRHAGSRFMPGAFVFAGGRVDDVDGPAAVLAEDRAWCEAQLADSALTEAEAVAFYVAAARELFEEAGVLLVRCRVASPASTPIDADVRARLFAKRAALNAGEIGFDALLASEDLVVDVRALVYWAHWITPSAERRRYDTRFFVAWMPPGQSADSDCDETTEHRWMGLGEALAAHHVMRLFLAPPTQRTLEELWTLAKAGALGAALDDPQVAPPILPKVLRDDAGIRIVLPGDSTYFEIPGASRAATLGPRQAVGPSQIWIRRPSEADTPDRAPVILRFWFGDGGDGETVDQATYEKWWKKDAAFDETCRDLEADVHRARDGGYAHWGLDPQRALARILLVDQIPRNIYRGTPDAFAFDRLALQWSQSGLRSGLAAQLPPLFRWFFFLPMMHAEDIDAQNEQVTLFEEMVGEVGSAARPTYERVVQFAIRHRDIVARFGRFPHRNEVLGRRSTPEEVEFLTQPGSSF